MGDDPEHSDLHSGARRLLAGGPETVLAVTHALAARRHYPNLRQLHGEDNPAHKLTDEAVREIRAARRAGATIKELAEIHGVTHQLVSMVARRVRWRHVNDNERGQA
jgi:hypothetical protein